MYKTCVWAWVWMCLTAVLGRFARGVLGAFGLRDVCVTIRECFR